MSIHGHVVVGHEIRDAVKDTIEKWIETYLAEIERREGMDPRSLPLPADYVTVRNDRLDKWPESQLPAVIIMSPGTSRRPSRKGDVVSAVFAVNVAVIVSSSDQEETLITAERYAAALLLLFTEQASLGGFAQTTLWGGQRWDSLPPEDGRTLASTINVFEVVVGTAVELHGGPGEPPEDPYEASDWPVAQTTHLDIYPED